MRIKSDESYGEKHGFHIYFLVKNASDIPRFGRALCNRLWLAGYGYISLSKCGGMLEKTIIDHSVLSPERIIFVGKPVIKNDNLMFCNSKPSLIDGKMLDTESFLDLTEDEAKKLNEIKSNKRSALSQKSKDMNILWSEDQVESMINNGIDEKVARVIIDNINYNQCNDLYGEFLLDFSNPKLGTVSIRDVLNNPLTYDEETLADPIEGRSYGSTTAKFYWNNGEKPFINSYAHGGKAYFIHIDPPVVMEKSVVKLFQNMALSDNVVEKMADAKFLIPNMIVQGHVAVYVAPANGGKTTIFTYLCEQLCSLDLDVYYVNVDAGPGDLKRHYNHAKQHGYRVIAPDAYDSMSTDTVIKKWEELINSDLDLGNVVFIVDTLKKFIDVINKSASKRFYKLLRSLTVKGATVCVLGHCNKHKDFNNKLVFEGTGDLRNDVDELIYLLSEKDEASNKLIVTTSPDKVRAQFSPLSFEIDLNNNRTVRELSKDLVRIPKDDLEIINNVVSAIKVGITSQTKIVNYIHEITNHSTKKIRKVLMQYQGKQGYEGVKSGQGNTLLYRLISSN